MTKEEIMKMAYNLYPDALPENYPTCPEYECAQKERAQLRIAFYYGYRSAEAKLGLVWAKEDFATDTPNIHLPTGTLTYNGYAISIDELWSALPREKNS